jgi:transcriptional regulator with XRE-family HTH domain
MVGTKESFGALVRREREAKKIGLREMAKMIEVSPTYLSKVERDEFSPPAEDKVKAIAKIIERDADDLLARAGKVSSDITDIIKLHPVELAALVRTTKGLSADDIDRLSRHAYGTFNILPKKLASAIMRRKRMTASAKSRLRRFD